MTADQVRRHTGSQAYWEHTSMTAEVLQYFFDWELARTDGQAGRKIQIMRSSSIRWIIACALGLMLCSPSLAADADDKDTPGAKSISGQQAAEAGNKNRNATDVEHDVREMVRLHLPELRGLLDQLKDKEPKQYQAAIRSLSRSARRLQSAKRRSEEAFELEVGVVKAQTAINLLIAKLKIRDHQRDRKELMQAAGRLERAELARLDYDVKELRKRIARMTAQLESAEKRLSRQEQSLQENVDKKYQAYLRKSGRKP